ncbi:MAG: crossover junction endodeoxyribonuclease RuvC [Bacteriovoracaceae bacterium]|nr:crossover junction endodeoxyribonuclease RuvC [Bacteriovoracaceae bacterium]
MLVLGIDPGSVTTGWALLKSQGKKTWIVASGVLEFNSKTEFLERLTQVRLASKRLIEELSPDVVAFESLIYVKSPQALIKLAQTRGVILAACVEKYQGKIFEYSPNLIKSVAVGHGHADKESVRKFLDMTLGKRDYKTHDESDAVAIAFCHIMNSGLSPAKSVPGRKRSSGGLAGALSHKIGK